MTPSTQVHLKSFTRAASGKIDDHVWIEKLDLRTHLQAPPSAPEGIDLLALCQKLLTNAIRPVLKEVNITGALGHIAGAFFSSSSSRGQSTLDVIPTPDVVAQETLKGMFEQAGFEQCDYQNLTGGIVALHRGYKF